MTATWDDLPDELRAMILSFRKEMLMQLRAATVIQRYTRLFQHIHRLGSCLYVESLRNNVGNYDFEGNYDFFMNLLRLRFLGSDNIHRLQLDSEALEYFLNN